MKFSSYQSEFTGTFFLVLFGTGAIIINDQHSGIITHPGIALAFGLVVMVMIYIFGEISGAHFNPAVSLGFFFRGRISKRDLIRYVLSQIAGALCASFLLRILLGPHHSMGATLPKVNIPATFLIEVVISFMLCMVIYQLSFHPSSNHLLDGFIIGVTVSVSALVFGPLTGASMNPARSLSPAIVSGNFHYLWIYLTAPIIGSSAAAHLSLLMWKSLHIVEQNPPNQSAAEDQPE